MKRLFLAPLFLLVTPAIAQTIPDAQDIPFPAPMLLNVDATNTAQGIFRVNQTIPVARTGPIGIALPGMAAGQPRAARPD